MKNSGLTTKDQQETLAVFKKFPEIESVFLFGSRAMGNYKPGSDVDLALVGKIDFSTIARVKALLEEHSSMPYFFDIIHYNTIENIDLKRHIDEKGVVVYRSITS